VIPIEAVCSSQPRRLGEVHPESVSLPLIAAGHLGTGVAELPLDVALIDLCGRGEAGAQRVSGEFLPPLGFGRLADMPPCLIGMEACVGRIT
jgi:hypothetical protein